MSKEKKAQVSPEVQNEKREELKEASKESVKEVLEKESDESVKEVSEEKPEGKPEEASEGVSEEEFKSFKKKRLSFQLLMVLCFVWLIGMGIVVMIKDSALLGLIVGVVFVGALVGTIIYGFSSYAVFCPHCHKLLGLEIKHCANCENELR